MNFAGLPVIPGVKRLDWPLSDPKEQPIERVRELRDEIRRRVRCLIEEEAWAKD